MGSPRLLIVDDEETILKQLEWAFKNKYEVIKARTIEEAVNAVKEESPQLMILDLSLTGDTDEFEGFQILEMALQIDPQIKVIVITGHDYKENALRALASGAIDFYSKPVDIDELRVILSRASYIHSLESTITRLKSSPGSGHEFENIISMSAGMLDIFDAVKKIAPTDVSVLITGESGTGKELIARAIHARSPRKNRPFIPINCGAIPENLLESELFGHEKGSFTGAVSSKPGKFEIAEGGTIFLDEIGELPLALQVKILRFLQDHVIERVGGQQQIQLDIRVIAATNRDLSKMIGERTFREDLYYRINTINISLPPLRDRGQDILLLAMHFLHHFNSEFSRNVRAFGQSARNVLYSHSWPGNVRELENRVKRAVIMTSGRIIQPEDMDLVFPGPEDEKNKQAESAPARIPPEAGVSLKEAREDLEQRMIIDVLLRFSGNVSAASQELKISRPTLHDLMKKHEIDPEDFRSSKKKK
ncbi:MAG: PEP-CTERM-box response regulator transcription factor [Candidatus Krumholzibacteriota bacterium]|nr:PEP-CTERM-box response regulator transcription factor [Candidatus Krumholzibacteriota bacterium]